MTFDALIERGITPTPTLFHRDLPQAPEDGGGWLARDTAARFADYAGHVRTAFDRPVVPEGLTTLPPGLGARHGDALPPIRITENGCSTAEGLDDPERVAFPDGHIAAGERGGQSRNRRPRLFRPVPAGQLRMGRGLSPTLRLDPCRLPDRDPDTASVPSLVARANRFRAARITPGIGHGHARERAGAQSSPFRVKLRVLGPGPTDDVTREGERRLFLCRQNLRVAAPP